MSWGQTTNSGGGDALDGLAKALKHLVVCEDDECLFGACGIHGLQLQLSNPIKTPMGEGSVDSKNMTQMLHCACDLQEALQTGLTSWKNWSCQSNVSRAPLTLKTNTLLT